MRRGKISQNYVAAHADDDVTLRKSEFIKTLIIIFVVRIDFHFRAKFNYFLLLAVMYCAPRAIT
jgi:hypothetical protein